MERIPNPPFSITLLRVWFLHQGSSSLQKGLLCPNPCGIFQGLLEPPSSSVLPSGLGLCWCFPHSPSHPKPRCPGLHFWFLPGFHTFFSFFFFSMFPWLDCNREEENEVSKNQFQHSWISCELSWVGLRYSKNPEPLRGWIKQMGAFVGFLWLHLGRRGDNSH